MAGDRAAFELVGGRLCLDFVNTVEGLRRAPRDLLAGYADLVAWAQQSGLLAAAEAQRLSKAGAAHPQRAARALGEARRLRESLYRVFVAAASGRGPAEEDLAAVNGWVASALAQRRIAPARAGFRLEWEGREDDLLAPLREVAASAAELLVSDQLRHVHVCAEVEADRCDWLFLDETRNRSRRFCTTEGCGNRAKARRHYQHVKAQQA
jgi:predicted RNA-binding Zn ribbon-like protein